MVYLFSNRAYGVPFLAAAARHARRTGASIAVVFSGQRRRERADGAAVSALRWLLPRWLSAREPAAHGLPVLIVDDVNAPAFVESIRPGDHGVIAGFDQIFGAPAIDRFQTFVNVHPSLLPFYRGPEPAYWCIQNGEAQTGFTIHSVTPRIDWGDIHYQEALAIRSEDDPASLTMRIAAAGVPAFERWLAHIFAGDEWKPVRLDATAHYRRHIGYRSFRPPLTAQT